ncbi:MAG: ABC transporter ATP-binding protein [Paracoccaceae bacterium]
MVRLDNISKTLRAGPVHRTVAQNISLNVLPGQAVALLGRNGVGKSTLLQMIAGSVRPDVGRVVVKGSVSWPVGFQGSFHPDLTGAQNARFLARVYGVDTKEFLAFIANFAELGPQINSPVRGYSSGMRARLGFACSMGIRFDTYLIDEVTSVGDSRFRSKCAEILQDRLRYSGAVLVSHNLDDLRRLCSMGAVLEKGRLHVYSDLERAIDLHERHLRYAGPEV